LQLALMTLQSIDQGLLEKENECAKQSANKPVGENPT